MKKGKGSSFAGLICAAITLKLKREKKGSV